MLFVMLSSMRVAYVGVIDRKISFVPNMAKKTSLPLPWDNGTLSDSNSEN